MKNTSLEVLDIMIDQFAARGILVLLDLHCLSTKGTNASPVFYDATHKVSDEKSDEGFAAPAWENQVGKARQPKAT